jgi:hypothetical protein
MSNLTRSTSDWTTENGKEEAEPGEHFYYDANNEAHNDEDEFGLPSITSSRRAARRAGDPGLDLSDQDKRANYIGISLLRPDTSNRPRANSSDIAEEREVPTYPSARKTEGKILRPQYKEILRGI